MNSLSRRSLFGSAAAVAAVSSPTIVTNRAYAAAPSLVPRKLPFPPNDKLGTYARLFNADSPPGLSLIRNSVRPSEVTDKKADSRIGNV